jgi:hypothetical protein
MASWSVITAFFEVTKEKHENLSENNLAHRPDSNQAPLVQKTVITA